MGKCGKQSIAFDKDVYILSSASIAGPKECDGPLGELFDIAVEDATVGQDSWEKGESEMVKQASELAVRKARLSIEDIRYVFSGDLLGQLIATTFGLKDLHVPLFGLYGACSTAGEALGLAAIMISAGYADHTLAVASSHFGSAEKQFRFPLEYGNQRPLAATWTVTGCGAFVVSSQESKAKITGITTGKIVDYGVSDSMNMGAVMAPAAADLIYQHMKDFNRKPTDYDRIITGDLGKVGQEILLNLLKENGYDIQKQHIDCGMLIYDDVRQDTHSGGSGCGCAAVTLAAYILPKIVSGEWKRVLFMPTGALLSTVSFNEGETIPGISHGVVIEHAE